MMTSRHVLAALAVLALLAAAMPGDAGPFAPAQAKPDHAEKGAAKGNRGGDKAKKGGRGNGQGGANGARGSDVQRTVAQWQRDWGIDDFLAAGLSAAIVRELLGGNVGALNTGASPLPPGIAKNLARGKPLPPGIANKQPGGAVLGALPRIDGHEWLEIGTSLVLIEVGTRIVRDIVHGIFH